MSIGSRINYFLKRLRKEYKIIVLDEASMVQKKAIRTTGMKTLGVVVLLLIIFGVLTTLLTTQTGLLRYLGPRPRAILGNDYLSLKSQIDSLQKLTEIQETKVRTIEKFLTERISSDKGDDMDEDVPSLKSKAKDKDGKASYSTPECLLPLMQFEKPVDGEVTSDFDAGKFHYGIDLAAPSDAEILAVEDGLVVINGYSREDGHVLMISHANGYISWYKHNSRNLVMPGREVIKGQPIAIIGNTGENSSGPHLHFELWQNDVPLNPRSFLKY